MATQTDKQLQVEFVKEAEKRNSVKFIENGRTRGIVAMIYVSKDALAKIGNPDALKVTVEPA